MRSPLPLVIAMLATVPAYAETTLLKGGGATAWNYLDDGSTPGEGWTAAGFDDSGWKAGGKAPLGYGEDGLGTELSFGGNPRDKHLGYFFRTEMALPEDAGDLETLTLTLTRDDGAVVFINGKEVGRSNLPPGDLDDTTCAVQALPTGLESEPVVLTVPAGVLNKEGANTVAVAVYQAAPTSSDLYFDLAIKGYAKGEAPEIDFYRDGMTAARRGDLARAAELLAQLPDDHPQYADTMALLAHRIYGEALGRAEDGLPFALKALEAKHTDRNVLRAYLKTHILAGTMFDPRDLVRERPAEIAPEHAFIASMPDIGDSSPTFTREQLEEDLDYLEQVLTHCFAYLELRPVDYRSALDAIRLSLEDETRLDTFTLAVAKLITLFCDGHAGVQRHESEFLPEGYAPFVASADGARTFVHRGGKFLDEGHPYLTAIDGKPLADWMRVAGYLVVPESPQWNRRHSLRNLSYITYLRAELGLPNPDTITLTLESADGENTVEKEVELAARMPNAREFPRGASRRIDNIGYLRIPRMTSNPRVLREIEEWMEEFRNTDGMVIDLRGNSGGTKSILFTLFPYFMAPDAPMKVVELSTYRLPLEVPKPTPQGFMMSDMSAQPVTSKRWISYAQREQVQAFIDAFEPEWKLPMEKFSMWHVLALDADINPDAYHYDKPLVILQDAGTFSAGDIFLGAFEDHPNTTLMGEASGGGNGWMEGYTLPNTKLGVTLCQSAKFRPNGKPYDGVGVPPDVEMLPEPADLLGESDTVLDAALERLGHKPQ